MEEKEKLTPVQSVEHFMVKFQQPVRDTPEFPPQKEIEFRLSLILEETIELAESCGSDVFSAFGRLLFKKSQEIHYSTEQSREKITANLVKVLDALKDLQYVTLGTEVSFGMQDISNEAFEEVHSSNMSKMCTSEEQANETLAHLQSTNKNGDKWPAHWVKNSPNTYLIVRDADLKVLKSKDYRPANLEQFIPQSNGS